MWTRAPFGDAELFSWRSADFALNVTSFGGVITSIETRDRTGQLGHVTLGASTWDGVRECSKRYFGCIAGRVANRIARGQFTLNGGKQYQLPLNNGPNSLHGGVVGFDKQIWAVEIAGADLVLRLSSPDGDQGYPAALNVVVTYRPSADGTLHIHYVATNASDTLDTIVNLTNHSYFNLRAQGESIVGHEVQLHASRFVPIDATLIPTGELRPVQGTPFDFRTATTIGARIDDAADEQLQRAGGYDHCFVVDGEPGTLRPAASVYEPVSGRTLEVLTTEPGVQLYTGNFLDGSIQGHNGAVYAKRTGFCLETEHFPNAVNEPTWPTTVLRAGQRFESTTVFKFGVRN